MLFHACLIEREGTRSLEVRLQRACSLLWKSHSLCLALVRLTLETLHLKGVCLHVKRACVKFFG